MDKLSFLSALAAKYIWRRKGRSLFILTSISAALIVSLLLLSLFSGMFAQITTAVTATNTGVFQLQEKNFADSYAVNTPRLLSPEMKKLDAYSAELILEANLLQPEGSASLKVLGIDPPKHQTVMELGQNLVAGDFFSQSQQGIIIGSELAQKFKFKLGDDFLFNFQDQEGNLVSEMLPITGIYDFNSKEFSKTHAYIHYQKWQEIFFSKEVKGQYFHRIVLNTLPSFPASWKLRLLSWREINPEMAVVIDFNQGLLRLFMVIIAFTVGLSIFNPIRMLLEERLSEFRMMSIIGVSSSNLTLLALIEAVLMMLISLVFSLVVYFILMMVLTRSGVDLSALGDGAPIERAGIEIPQIIYPLMEVKFILLSLVFVTVTIGLSYALSFRAIVKKIRGVL